MTALRLHPRWLAGDFDDPGEAATFAELSVSVYDEPVSLIEDPDTGRVSEGTRIPALPLAIVLAQRWWRLLYEPEKRIDRHAEARHRLDVLTPGYVFPPLAIWSGGEGIVARLLTPDLRFQRQRFVLPEWEEPWYLPRGPVEDGLRSFIEATLFRLPAGTELAEAWQRVRASMEDSDEQAWCMAAGRLGLDPYDPNTPDLETLAGSLSPELFADLSEAATVEELPPARAWIEAQVPKLSRATVIDIDGLGSFPSGDVDDYPAHVGYAAAERLRADLSLDPHPKKAVQVLLGKIDVASHDAPYPVQGVGHRTNGELRAAVAAADEDHARFRLLRATYLGWRAAPGEDILVGRAKTRRHQAAGAFAAELLAPKQLLEERITARRPTQAQLRQWAREFGTKPGVVQDQLWNRLGLTVSMAA